MGAAGSWAEVKSAAVPAAWAAQLDERGVGAPGRPSQDWLAHWMRGSLLSVVDALPVILEAFGPAAGAIDDALARAERSSSERPVGRRVAVDDPYAVAKSRLLQVVGEANGVRCVW